MGAPTEIWNNMNNNRAKNWRSHGRQWRVKTDQGHQELTVKRPMCEGVTKTQTPKTQTSDPENSDPENSDP